ncbi:hypothetical protein [Saccharopolyspora taberi]
MARQTILPSSSRGSFKTLLLLAAVAFVVIRWPNESAFWIRDAFAKVTEFATTLLGGA